MKHVFTAEERRRGSSVPRNRQPMKRVAGVRKSLASVTAGMCCGFVCVVRRVRPER